MKNVSTVVAFLSLAFTAWGAPAERYVTPSEGSQARRAEITGDWTYIGEGTYKDVLFSDLFGKQAQTLKVRFEQNDSDPTLYRIPVVYENMDFTAYGSYLKFDSEKATPMVFHVYNDEFAYFDEFDTGVEINYTSGADLYQGEVRMLMQGVDLLEYNDIQSLAYYLPEALCHLVGGNFTMEASFNLEGRAWNNILGLVYVTGTPYDKLFRGNVKGDFFVTLPDAQAYDPDELWEDIGLATYTDAFTEGLYTSSPQYLTWEVPMQRHLQYREQYRLVNPYAGWKGSIPGISYDSGNTYYMNLQIQEFDGFSLVGIPSFYTGLEKAGSGVLGVSNQAADVLNYYPDFLTLYNYFPGCLGQLKDGVITYASHCVIDMEYYLNFFAYFGAMNPDGPFYSANAGGNFKIVMPGAQEGDAGVSGPVEAADEPAAYYTTQGVKVENPAKGQLLVRKQGSKSKLIIF